MTIMNIRTKPSYRKYSDLQSSVAKTYLCMHQHQTKNCVDSLRARFTQPSECVVRKRLIDLFPILDQIIDDSDPDTSLPQIHHAYQTSEALKIYCDDMNPTQLKKNILIADLFGLEWETLPLSVKKSYPTYLHELYPDITDWSWLPLIGFLHDMGKVLASAEWGALPQWQVVGDTFPINAPFASSNIFYEEGFYKRNPNLANQKQTSTHFGEYKKHCGLNNVLMSFGHDEYMFLILNNTIHHLPMHALYIIRFHSFYAWHTPRNGERGYTELASDNDWHLLPLLKAFQQSDLYSKTDNLLDNQKLEKEYVELIEKFVPGRMNTRYNLRPAKLKMSDLEKDVMPSSTHTAMTFS